MNPPPPPPSYTKPFMNGSLRMRSGSGGSRTTATSDSGDLDPGNITNTGQPTLSASSSPSHPSYSNGNGYANGNASSAGSTGTFSMTSPGPSQHIALPNPAAALSPIANRMRERDADAMEKYLRRNRSGSASTDTKSQNGSNFSSAGPSANGDDITSMPPSGTTTPRKTLRPSLSAAQLRSNTQPPSIVTINATPTDSFRNRAGTNPTAPRPNPATLSPTPVLARSSSIKSETQHDRTLFEEPENFQGPSVQFATFPEPPPDSPGSLLTTPTGRRLPFHLLSKTVSHEPPPAVVTAGGHSHRRGSSANSIR